MATISMLIRDQALWSIERGELVRVKVVTVHAADGYIMARWPGKEPVRVDGDAVRKLRLRRPE